VVRISQIVECRIVKRIKSDSLEIVLNRLLVVVLVAVAVANVVVALYLFRVDLESLLVVIDGLLDVLKKVVSVCEIVEDIRDFIVNLNGPLVVLDCFLWFSEVVESIGKSNQCLDLLWVIDQSLLEVFCSCLCVTRLEKKVSKSDHTDGVLGVDLEAGLQEVGSVFHIVFLKVDDTNLTMGLVVILVVLDDESVMFQGFIGQSKLLENLSKTKMSWNTGWVELDSMLKVLLCSVEVSAVCELGGQVNTGTKVGLVEQ
jgi:hypothetical protein